MYRDHGYTSASVSNKLEWKENQRQVDIVISVNEGLQVLIDSISITGQNKDYTSEILSELTISHQSPFLKKKIEENEIIISRYIGEKGYPNVKVNSNIIFNEEKTGVKIQYAIEEGKFVRMGESFFRGNFKTREHILKKKMLLSDGEPFSLIKMVEGQRNIRNMNLFNSVKYKAFGLSERRDTVTLFVDIDEKESYSTDFGLGFVSHEDVYAKIKATNLNLAGLNKNLVINGRVSIKEQWTGISFIEPDLWEKPISAFIDLSAKRVIDDKDSYWLLGPSIGLQRKIGKNIFTNISVTYELRKLFSVSDPTRNILKFSPSINYDNRDSFTRPQKGLYSALNLIFAKGLGKSYDDFIKSKFDFRFYLTPLKNLTIAARNQFWHVTPYGRINTLPVDQKFSIGGPLTVRGFRNDIRFSYKNNDKFTGYAAYIGNMEFRIDVGFNFELALFLDAGGLGNNFFQNRWFGTRFTAGGGLRYHTPIGPVGLLYGFKINRKPDEKEYGAPIFSIGYMF
jgi:outer membrane protein insertion porin family